MVTIRQYRNSKKSLRILIFDQHWCCECCHLNLYLYLALVMGRSGLSGLKPETRSLPSFLVPRIARIGGVKRVITRPDVTIVMADHLNLILCLTTKIIIIFWWSVSFIFAAFQLSTADQHFIISFSNRYLMQSGI